MEVDRDAKAALARIMVIDLPTSLGLSPLMVCAERFEPFACSRLRWRE